SENERKDFTHALDGYLKGLGTFQLVDGVVLAGGYAGLGAPDADDRDISIYVTTLSGDLAGDDDPDPVGSSFLGYDENSRHVVTGSGNDDTAIIDGVTVTAGNATVGGHNSGGGMIIKPDSERDGSPIVRNCRFEYNRAIGGSGIEIWDRSPEISGSTFIGNDAYYNGGAIRCVNVTSVTISNCSFIANCSHHREFGGGAIAVQSPGVDGQVAITGCLFLGNSAVFEGGAIVSTQGGNTTLSQSTVVGNSAGEAGGGLCAAAGGTIEVVNSIIYSNTSSTGKHPQIFVLDGDGEVRVSWSNTEGGLKGSEHIINVEGNIDAPPLFVDQDNGDLRLSSGSPCIDAGDSDETMGTEDLDGNPRFQNDCTTPDTGSGTPPIVDMGAYEFPSQDLDDSGAVGTGDLLAVLAAWGPCEDDCPEDIDDSGAVGVGDLLIVLAAWGPCA
ncbi:MAG: choice-of-anchor Q domain-containing protein, partial [Planctomycetota bacterium]